MLTPQEVSSHAFPKAVMGGYNMSSVDEFLDELTEDYASLYKENAALKAKLKVLVEKVEDYRATEDAMRSTLLTAQKMADSIVKEAEAKRDRIAVQTEAEARAKLQEMEAEITEAQQRLRAGQQDLAGFIAASRELCSKELAFLDRLPKLPVETPPPTAETAEQQKEEATREIEQNLYATFRAESAQAEAAKAAELQAAAAEKPAPEDDYPSGNPFAADDELTAEDKPTARESFQGKDEPTRKLDLKELKFGRNYLGGDN